MMPTRMSLEKREVEEKLDGGQEWGICQCGIDQLFVEFVTN